MSFQFSFDTTVMWNKALGSTTGLIRFMTLTTTKGQKKNGENVNKQRFFLTEQHAGFQLNWS